MMMMELQRLSYDRKLAEELELTVEQKVDIREAQQKFQLAMQEQRKATEGGGAFDMQAYTKMDGRLDDRSPRHLDSGTSREASAFGETQATQIPAR